jgi:transmembrane sensor
MPIPPTVPSLPPSLTWADVADVIAGDAAPDIQSAVNEWREKSTRNERLFDVLSNEWHLEGAGGWIPDVDGMRRRVAEALTEDRAAARSTGADSERAHRRSAAHEQTQSARTWAMIGSGSLVVGAVIALLAVRHHQSPTPPMFGTSTFTTGRHEQRHVTLADGTRLTLAPGTTARTSRGENGERLVTLSGEARFDVPNATVAPFVVRTGTIETRVLGTTFDVRRYTTDTVTRVHVHTGKVAVAERSTAKRARTPLTVIANQVAVVGDSTQRATSADVATQVTDWTNGRLVFRGATVHDILATLSRWYGVRFQLADSALAVQRLSATFEYRTPSDGLATLALLLDVDLSTHDDLVTLRRRSGARPSLVPVQRRTTRDSISTYSNEVGR